MKKSLVKLVATSAVALTLSGAAVSVFAEEGKTVVPATEILTVPAAQKDSQVKAVEAAEKALKDANDAATKFYNENKFEVPTLEEGQDEKDPAYVKKLEDYKKLVDDANKLEEAATAAKAKLDAENKKLADLNAKEDAADAKEAKAAEAEGAKKELEKITQVGYTTKEEAVKAAKDFFNMYKNDSPVASFSVEKLGDKFFLKGLVTDEGEIKPDVEVKPEVTPETKPEESSKEESSKEECSKEESSKEADKPAAKPAKKDEKKAELPQTGEASTFAIAGAAVLSALAGLGFVAKKEN